MSELSENIQNKVESLPHNQALFYGTLIEAGGENIFKAIKGIHADIDSGEIAEEYKPAASLALASLNEILHGEAPPRVKSNEAAYLDVMGKIDAAEVAGDMETAELLKASVQSSLDSSEQQIAADKKFVVDNEEMLAGLQQAKQARFESALAEESDRQIVSLQRGTGRTREEAQAHYQEYFEPKLTDALSKAFGV